jgi:hypothetical protein
MTKKYYVLVNEYPAGPMRGDVLVWEGDVWNSSKDGGLVYMTRYLWDFDGYYFLTPRDDLVEFVSEKDLEDPSSRHNDPVGQRRIWNIPNHV